MFVRFHISSHVRSLVTGSLACRASQGRIVRGGAHHEHLVDALEGHDLGFDAHHGVGADAAGLGRDAASARWRVVLKISLNSLISPRARLFRPPSNPPPMPVE